MKLGLEGRGVVITGASRGIGLATALAFADVGAHVAICARGAESLGSAADALRTRGVKVCAETCDVADAGALASFLASAHGALGRVDVLVNNASGFGLGDDEKSWRASFEVDLMPAVRASRAVIPWLDAQGGGAIVHVSSTAALGAPAPPAYAALKAALTSHAKNLSIELAPHRIRVNCVAPGAIEFPGGLWDRIKQHAPDRYAAMLATIPSGRLGTPEEVARAIVFLCSDAASWITGVTLWVDGGTHRSIR